MRTFMSAVVLLSLVGLASAAERKPVKFEDVPNAVKVAASAAAASVEKWVFAISADGPNGTTVYELFGKNEAGKVVTVLADHKGAVSLVRVEVALNDVPAAARDGVARKHPAFKATEVTALGKTDDVCEATGYAYTGTGPGGKRMVIVVSYDGVVVTVVQGGEPAPKPAPAVPPPAAKPTGELKALQGSWKVVAGRKAGEALAAADGAEGRLVVTGDLFELLQKDGTVIFKGTLTVRADADGNTFDVDRPKDFTDLFGMKKDVTDAFGLKPAALHLRGIYALKGGELQLCFTRGDEHDIGRPKSLEDAGSEFGDPVDTEVKRDPNCYYFRLEKIEAKK